MPPGLKNHTVLCLLTTAAIHSPFGRPVHVFMVGHDRERGRNSKCAVNEDETWLHVYDHGNIIYQAVGVMNAVRFSFFLVGARTNMDPNKWVIFVSDKVPAHRDSAIPAPYVQTYVCIFTLMNVCLHYWSPFHANDCVFSLNEQQKVYNDSMVYYE